MSHRESTASGPNHRLIVGIAAGILLATTFAIGAGMWRHYRTVPAFAFTPPPVPRPNAYDYYLRAGELLMQVPNYQRACSVHTPPDKAAPTLALCDPAVQEFRAGTAHACGVPLPDDLAAQNPKEMERLVWLARALAARSRLALSQGDTDGALQWSLHAVRLGVDIPRGGLPMHWRIGAICEAKGSIEIQALGAQLDAAQCRKTLRELRRLEARRAPVADALRLEHAEARRRLQEIAQNPSALQFQSRIRPSSLLGLTPFTWNLRGAAREVGDYFALLTQQVSLPTAGHALPLPPRHPVARMLIPSDALMRAQQNLTLTRLRLLQVALALRAYQLDRGRPAAALADLVPDYLPMAPEDPFAGRSLQYAKAPTPSVYSIGPDGKDDGGKAMIWANALNALPGDLVVRLGAVREPQ